MDSFPQDFRAGLQDLMRWRRDVRRFRTDPVEAAVLDACLAAFALSPSVGLSEPWRLLRLRSAAVRAQALENFSAANARALAGYDGEKATRYASLKLSGMQDAPEQIAVFCDEATDKGQGLGVATMPEMRRYSVVSAITCMWLTARAHGLGVGWVSILDADRLARDSDVPRDWTLVAYLCIGWPERATLTPELETSGWEARSPGLLVEDR